jgi:hypothetical protein
MQELSLGSAGAAAPADTAEWLCSALKAVAVVCQQPLVLAKGGELLRDAFTAAGAVQAALMCHHISLGENATTLICACCQLLQTVNLQGSRFGRYMLSSSQCAVAVQAVWHDSVCWCAVVVYCLARLRAGASATQRQLMLAASQLSRKQQQANPTAACTESAPDSPLAQQMQLSSYAEVLQQAATAADGCCQGVPDQSAKLQAVGEAVDTVAATWLSNLLQHLPQGTAICTISRQARSNTEPADSLLVSRVAYDAAQCRLSSALLVRLPPPSQGGR